MKISSKVFKRKSGISKGKWVARITYFDSIAGKTRYLERQSARKSDVTDMRDRLVNELNKTHGQSPTGERMTFNNLVDVCERVFYKPAEIIQGKKIAGIRSIVNVRSQLKFLREFFGTRLVNEITTESLTDYKLWRLKTISPQTGKPVSIASPNRELAAMRRMMRYAYSKGWVLRDIFFNAKIIDTGSEVERTRILTNNEEIRLLQACEVSERTKTYLRVKKSKEERVTAQIYGGNACLKALILIALDSGLRKSEILNLSWEDFDFENESIHVIASNTKTERERFAPLTDRTMKELQKVKELNGDPVPFPFKDFKRSFSTAKEIAEIEDLHFHDLRRTAITRWQEQGVSLAIAGKLAGHAKLQTTMKHYTATDSDSVKEVARKLNKSYGNSNSTIESHSSLVN